MSQPTKEYLLILAVLIPAGACLVWLAGINPVGYVAGAVVGGVIQIIRGERKIRKQKRGWEISQ